MVRMACDEVWLVRHGETEWSRDGRHTSTTDLPLTPDGERVAAGIRDRLDDDDFALVLTSPRRRARETAGSPATPRPRSTTTSPSGTTATWRARPPRRSERPTPTGRSGAGRCPAARPRPRSRRVSTGWSRRCRAADGRVLVFGHGHSLRALAARWLELPVTDGRHLRLDTATVSVLGYERETPVVLRWNS